MKYYVAWNRDFHLRYESENTLVLHPLLIAMTICAVLTFLYIKLVTVHSPQQLFFYILPFMVILPRRAPFIVLQWGIDDPANYLSGHYRRIE